MRRLFFILIAVFCGFTFLACEEEDTDYTYFVKTYEDMNTSYHDIVIFEKDKYGDIIRRREIQKMSSGSLSSEFLTDDNTTEIDIYYKMKYYNQIYYKRGGDQTSYWDKKRDNIIYLSSTTGGMTEQEYNEYVN